MGGNCEAYSEAKAEAAAARESANRLLDNYGRGALPESTLLLVHDGTRLVIGNKKELLMDGKGGSAYDILPLLKALGYKVKRVRVESE